MLEAIRKFGLERGRDPHQSRRVIVAENGSGHAPINCDVPPGPAEPELEGSSGLAVRGQVKWFNPNKGYGFVQLSDGSGDAFLHVTALAGIGVSTVQPGETLELRVALAQRGAQVTEVISVDTSPAAPPRSPRERFRSPSHRRPLEASVQSGPSGGWSTSLGRLGFIQPGSAVASARRLPPSGHAMSSGTAPSLPRTDPP